MVSATLSAAGTTAQQLRAARAWRQTLGAHAPGSGAYLKVVRRCDRHDVSGALGIAPHCADLFVQSDARADAARLVVRLGELLRLVFLATAPHVDPIVFNALFDDDALCVRGPALCTRCDAVGRGSTTPIVTISVGRDWSDPRSGVGLLHDALFAWQDDGAASAEFVDLRDALQSSTGARVPVELNVSLGMLRDDGDAELRDVQKLMARYREAERDGTGEFRLARVLPIIRAAEIQSPQYEQLHAAIVDTGICTRLAPLIHTQSTPVETERAWRWLINWAERANTPPNIDSITIIRRPSQTTELLATLLRLVAVNNPTLRRLTLFWPLHMETDDEERRRAAEAIGAALFAPHATIRLDKLELDMGDLTVDDVAALRLGAGWSGGFVPTSDQARRTPRFGRMEWKALHVSEPCIQQVAQLVGIVGVSKLKITVGDRDLSCHALKSVLEVCAGVLKNLDWPGLSCGDASEFESSTTWSDLPTRLCGLRLSVRDEGDPNTLRALDALLDRIGFGLVTLEVSSLQDALSGRVADIIVARCPRLVTLIVANASPQFYAHLTEAFDQNRCGISALRAKSIPRQSDTGWPILLDALGDSSRGAARKLRSLTLETLWMDDHTADVEFNALLASLAANTSLTHVVVEGILFANAKEQLRTLPNPYAIRLPSLPCRLALLSVFNGVYRDRRLRKLPLDLLQIVFAFAGRRTRRYEFMNFL